MRSYYGAILHEKVHFTATKNCNWKTIYCLFLQHYTENAIFYSVVMREKMNEWKFWAEKYVRLLLNGKKINFLPQCALHDIDVVESLLFFFFYLDTLDCVIRDFDLIRWKKILKNSTENCFPAEEKKVIFHLAKFFFMCAKVKMNTEHLTNCDRIHETINTICKSISTTCT